MRQRQRKFLGMFACIVVLVVYCLAAMGLGAVYVVGSSTIVETAFFVFAGMAWLPLVMPIIRWMSRPDKS